MSSDSLERPISDGLKDRLFLSQVINYRPESDPFVYLARSHMVQECINEIGGKLKQFIGIHAYLAPIESKKQITNNILSFTYDRFNIQMQTYFEEDGSYVTGEVFERERVDFEHIVNDRYFDGLTLGYYEPTDRLVLYLNLHRKGNEWLNPHSEDVIVKTGEMSRGWDPHDCYLSIRKSELCDYLAARKAGLLVTRYSESMLTTAFVLKELPPTFSERQTKHGKCYWYAGKDSADQREYLYFFRLWESFWIDPASKPRRWDSQPRGEHKDGIAFVLADGESSTYKQDGRDRYFQLISFNPEMLRSHESQPNNSIEMTCTSCLTLRYADASYLHGCINSEGQFQAFFGSVAKLDLEKQRQITAFSTAQKARPAREYIRTSINGEFPETRPFPWTLSTCLELVTQPWRDSFGESLLLAPRADCLPTWVSVGPTSRDFAELPNIMLELQKAVIYEGSIDSIKKNLDYSSLCADRNAYKGMRSIGFIKLLFSANRPDKGKGKSYILEVVNKLRICKAHRTDYESLFGEHGIPFTTPRAAFLHIMAEFCLFLVEFRDHTATALQVEVTKGEEDTDSPWNQMGLAQQYFANPS